MLSSNVWKHHSSVFVRWWLFTNAKRCLKWHVTFQDLTLTITSERSEAELDLEEDNSEISSINVQSFVDEQEWRLHSHVETWKRVTTRIYQNSKYKHPALSTSCRASRRPGFFIWNIFLVMVMFIKFDTYRSIYSVSKTIGNETKSTFDKDFPVQGFYCRGIFVMKYRGDRYINRKCQQSC